jgi:hypothetical protein
MSATADGKLAVLSDETTRASHCVKVFDPVTGYISSTQDIDITRPLSLGVTLQNQYVILGDNEQGEKQIIVVDNEGAVEHRHVMNPGLKLKNPKRITCGGRYIFVNGDQHVIIYKITDTGLEMITETYLTSGGGYLADISATIWDDFLQAKVYQNAVYLSGFQQSTDNLEDYYHEGDKIVLEWVTAVDLQSRVSTRDGHIVISHGQTIRVYNV